MSKKPKKLGNKPKDFTAQLYKILSKEPSKSYNYKQIAAILELSDTKSRNEIIRDLKILKKQDDTAMIAMYRYISRLGIADAVLSTWYQGTWYGVVPMSDCNGTHTDMISSMSNHCCLLFVESTR